MADGGGDGISNKKEHRLKSLGVKPEWMPFLRNGEHMALERADNTNDFKAMDELMKDINLRETRLAFYDYHVEKTSALFLMEPLRCVARKAQEQVKITLFWGFICTRQGPRILETVLSLRFARLP